MPTGWVSPQGLARPRVGWRPNVTPEFLQPFNSWSVCMRGGASWEVECFLKPVGWEEPRPRKSSAPSKDPTAESSHPTWAEVSLGCLMTDACN